MIWLRLREVSVLVTYTKHHFSRYLLTLFQLYTPARPLRSLENNLLVIPIELNIVKQLLVAMLLSSGTNFLMQSTAFPTAVSFESRLKTQLFSDAFC